MLVLLQNIKEYSVRVTIYVEILMIVEYTHRSAENFNVHYRASYLTLNNISLV